MIVVVSSRTDSNRDNVVVISRTDSSSDNVVVIGVVVKVVIVVAIA